MATWASYTTAQQKQVTDYMVLQRAQAGQLARLLHALDASNVSWNQAVSTLVTGLDVATVIPDNSGLAGIALSRHASGHEPRPGPHARPPQAHRSNHF
jgi:hypothetical protein